MISAPLLAAVGAALGLLMSVAGVAKLRAPSAARAAIRTYGLPEPAARVLAAPLGAVETIAGLAVAWPSSRADGAVVVLLLLSLYSAAIAGMIARGRTGADCGCGGLVGGVPIGFGLLLRNIVLCMAAAAAALLTAPAPQGALQWIASAVIALVLWSCCVLGDYALARGRQLADD